MAFCCLLLFLFFRTPRLAGSLLCLFFIFLCIGLMRGGLSEHRVTPEQVDFYNGEKVELIGVITETDVRRNKAKYSVEVDEIMTPEGAIGQSRLRGTVLISLNKYPLYDYGDRVKIVGELSEPGEFDGFNYGNYLSRYGIYCVMYYPYIEVLETGQGNFFWHRMSWLQNKFLGQINRLFPEPHASFEAGLLVGARKGIPEDLMEQFNITGLTHIIAISGYNITIIIVFVMWMLSGLPRRLGFVVAIAAIVLFTLFVGASPAVVRASIMGILGLIALNYGRQNNIHLTVLWSAAFMVGWNPKILWWDVGFQLSFAAVLGLIYVAPMFDKYAKKLPQAFGVREAIQMTLSAQVMALPIIIFNFERLSLIAPLANLFVIFAIPPAMMFGFVGVLFSFIFHPLGLIPAYMAWGILSYIIKVIEITAAIPYASVNLPGMKIWMMFGYYGVLILGLYLYHKKETGFRKQEIADS
ncbi:ComEC family competence protein [Patescibacteria group bacterium]|nr:ComEC family competence protein [Patescibacteria group bacterium]